MVEGELPADGLAALEGDGSDVVLALPRRLTESGDGNRRESLEALFAEARRFTEESDELLVEASWDGAAEPESELVLVSGPVPDATPGDLPLFTAATTPPPPETASPTGKVVTFTELALMLRRPKPRRRAVPASQLALFGT